MDFRPNQVIVLVNNSRFCCFDRMKSRKINDEIGYYP